MGADPSAPPQEVEAHEVFRARRATAGAHDPGRGGPGPAGRFRRGLQDGSSRGPGWSRMRYFLRAPCPPGGLTRRVVHGADEAPAVLPAGSTQALRAGRSRADLAAVDLAAVAARADVANRVAARAEIASIAKSGQASLPEGWTKTPKTPTLETVVATRRPWNLGDRNSPGFHLFGRSPDYPSLIVSGRGRRHIMGKLRANPQIYAILRAR